MNEVELMDLIKKFLSNPRASDGGWAEVTKEDMNDIQEIIRILCQIKFEEDPDGDIPLDFQIVNRNEKRFLLSQWSNTIPYAHKIKNKDHYFQVLNSLNTAIKICSDEASRMTQFHNEYFEEFSENKHHIE